MHHTRRFGKSILPDLRGKINQEVLKLNTLAINGQDIAIKEHQGQRVVTFKEIDRVHQRPNGTAGRNFRENRKFLPAVPFGR